MTANGAGILRLNNQARNERRLDEGRAGQLQSAPGISKALPESIVISIRIYALWKNSAVERCLIFHLLSSLCYLFLQ